MTTELVLRALPGKELVGVRQAFYVVDDEIDTSDCDLELVFADGVAGFRSGGDGQTLVVHEEPWVDPFDNAMTPENVQYLRTHGRSVLFDVSDRPGWNAAIGHAVERVREDRSEGFLGGVAVQIGPVCVEVDVVADELHVRVVA